MVGAEARPNPQTGFSDPQFLTEMHNITTNLSLYAWFVISVSMQKYRLRVRRENSLYIFSLEYVANVNNCELEFPPT